MIRCGACGGKRVKISVTRYGCSTARHRDTCDNLLAIKRAKLEDHVLPQAMREHLMEPMVFEESC